MMNEYKRRYGRDTQWKYYELYYYFAHGYLIVLQKQSNHKGRTPANETRPIFSDPQKSLADSNKNNRGCAIRHTLYWEL